MEEQMEEQITLDLISTFSDVYNSDPQNKIIEDKITKNGLEERFEEYLKLQKESEYNTNSDEYLKNKREKFKGISKINRHNKKQ